MKSILDRTFRYVPARLTNVAATFRRVRREQEEMKREQQAKVRELKKGTNK